MHSILVQCLFASTKPSSQISPLNTAPVTARNDDGIFGPTVEAQTNHHTNLAARTETNPLQRWDTVSRSDGRVSNPNRQDPTFPAKSAHRKSNSDAAGATHDRPRTNRRSTRAARGGGGGGVEVEEEGGGVEVEDAAAEQQ